MHTLLAVIVVMFAESPALLPNSIPWLTTTVAEVDSYYAEQSYGTFTPHSSVFGPYTVPLTITATRGDIATAARQAMIDAGINPADYSDFVYISPVTNSVRAGYGDAAGVWIAQSYPDVIMPDFAAIAHELGHHFFGLVHASSQWCTDNTPLGTGGGTCTISEYGDYLDVMGNSFGHFSGTVKAKIGWLTTRTVTASGDYVIEPLELMPQGGNKVLLVEGGSGQRTRLYALEYRQPTGYDTQLAPIKAMSDNLWNGVVMRLMTNRATLLFMSPSQPTDLAPFMRPALPTGQKYCDGKLNITTISATSAGAVVRVKFGGKC